MTFNYFYLYIIAKFSSSDLASMRFFGQVFLAAEFSCWHCVHPSGLLSFPFTGMVVMGNMLP